MSSIVRTRRVLHLMVLVVSAYFCADISMAILGARLGAGARASQTPAATAAVAAPRKMRSNVQFYSAPVLEKNLFGEAPPSGTKGEGGKTEQLPETQLDQKVLLVGTAVADSPEHSIAVIEDKTSHKQEAYRVRDMVLEEATVSAIEPSCVVLLRAGQKERLCLKLGDEGGKMGTRTVSAATATSPAGSPAGYVPSADAIQRVDDSTFRVDAEEVRKAMENLSSLFTQVRAVPNFREGKTDGFRLFSIKRDSMFDKMGLKNGDVIRKINDYEINSPEVALQLFQDLRNARDVSIEVLRADKSQSIAYQIR